MQVQSNQRGWELILPGEKPRPVCVACHKADLPTAKRIYQRHVCAGCLAKLEAGQGLNIQPMEVARAEFFEVVRQAKAYNAQRQAAR